MLRTVLETRVKCSVETDVELGRWFQLLRQEYRDYCAHRETALRSPASLQQQQQPEQQLHRGQGDAVGVERPHGSKAHAEVR